MEHKYQWANSYDDDEVLHSTGILQPLHNNYLIISCYIILVLIPGFLANIYAVLCHIVSEAFSKQLCTVFHFGKRSFACACTYIAQANVSSSQYYGMHSIDGVRIKGLESFNF